MPESCSCGTQLVENAIFCHRCGKAQRALLPDSEPELAAAAEPVIEPAIAAPLPISFSNSLVVRFCFLVASVASVLDAMPAVQLLCILWSVGAGFVAVMLYHRATGRAINLRGGARIGLITGVLNSLILTVLTTISVISSSAELNAALREQLKLKASADPAALAIMDSPYFLAAAILFMLFVIFVVVTGSCVLGGTLGAKIFRDQRAPGHQPR